MDHTHQRQLQMQFDRIGQIFKVYGNFLTVYLGSNWEIFVATYICKFSLSQMAEYGTANVVIRSHLTPTTGTTKDHPPLNVHISTLGLVARRCN